MNDRLATRLAALSAEKQQYILEALPTHLVEAGYWGLLERVLTDLSFLEAKAQAGKIRGLVDDLSESTRKMPFTSSWRGVMRLMEEALRIDLNFIARHPSTLFQCLWNRCWWHDCDVAFKYFILGKENSPLRSILKDSIEPRLSTLLDSWRRSKERATPGFTWLRSLRPLYDRLGGATHASFRGFNHFVSCTAYSSDGKLIVAGSFDHTIRVLDANSGIQLALLKGHNGKISFVSFSLNSRQILSASKDKSVKIWDVKSGREEKCLQGHDDSVLAVHQLDELNILTASCDGTLRTWNTQSMREIKRITGISRTADSAAFSPDGSFLATADLIGYIEIWNVEKGIKLWKHRPGVTSANCVSFSKDGKRLAAGFGMPLANTFRMVVVWNVDCGGELLKLTSHDKPVGAVDFSQDGKYLASGSHDSKIRVWDADSGKEIIRLEGQEAHILSLAFSPDGEHIVSGSADKTLRVWNLTKTADPRRLREHSGGIMCLAFSSNNRYLATGSMDFTVRVWDTQNGTELHCLYGHEGHVSCVAFSADGGHVGSGSRDGTIRVWDVHYGVEIACLRNTQQMARDESESMPLAKEAGEAFELVNRVPNNYFSPQTRSTNFFTCLAFSPDGGRIASGSVDHSVRIWDVASRTEIRRIQVRVPNVRCLSFSNDGKLIAGGSDDGTLLVWDDDGTEVHCFDCDSGAVSCVSFFADCIVISRNSEGEYQLWYLDEALTKESFSSLSASLPVPCYDCRILTDHQELMVTSRTTGEPIAWFPSIPWDLVQSEDGITWAGAITHHLYLLRIESS